MNEGIPHSMVAITTIMHQHTFVYSRALKSFGMMNASGRCISMFFLTREHSISNASAAQCQKREGCRPGIALFCKTKYILLRTHSEIPTAGKGKLQETLAQLMKNANKVGAIIHKLSRLFIKGNRTSNTRIHTLGMDPTRARAVLVLVDSKLDQCSNKLKAV